MKYSIVASMDVVGSLVLLDRGYCMKKKLVELDCLY